MIYSLLIVTTLGQSQTKQGTQVLHDFNPGSVRQHQLHRLDKYWETQLKQENHDAQNTLRTARLSRGRLCFLLIYLSCLFPTKNFITELLRIVTGKDPQRERSPKVMEPVKLGAHAGVCGVFQRIHAGAEYKLQESDGKLLEIVS